MNRKKKKSTKKLNRNPVKRHKTNTIATTFAQSHPPNSNFLRLSKGKQKIRNTTGKKYTKRSCMFNVDENPQGKCGSSRISFLPQSFMARFIPLSIKKDQQSFPSCSYHSTAHSNHGLTHYLFKTCSYQSPTNATISTLFYWIVK